MLNKFEIAPKKNNGNVCVFHEDGGMKFVYRGNGEEFNPHAICCDSLCNIICANTITMGKYNVHIIDCEGSFLKHLFTNDTCVPAPLAVELYKDVLWVGSFTGDARVYRYKQ